MSEREVVVLEDLCQRKWTTTLHRPTCQHALPADHHDYWPVPSGTVIGGVVPVCAVCKPRVEIRDV